MLSDSFEVIWQFVVFLVLPLNYPDVGRKSDQNGLVINNVIKHVLYLFQGWCCYIGLQQFIQLIVFCGRVTQICVFTLQLCKTDDANQRF